MQQGLLHKSARDLQRDERLYYAQPPDPTFWRCRFPKICILAIPQRAERFRRRFLR